MGEVLTWVACTLLFSSKLENLQAKLFNSSQQNYYNIAKHLVQLVDRFLESEIASLRLLIFYGAYGLIG